MYVHFISFGLGPYSPLVLLTKARISEQPESSTLFIWGFQESLWSIVNPRYLTSVTYFIFFPYNFIGRAMCLPDLWNIIANVFSGLNVRLHLLPQVCNWLSSICKVFVM